MERAQRVARLLQHALELRDLLGDVIDDRLLLAQARLLCEVEPTRTALAMADAIHQHAEDLLNDDPGAQWGQNTVVTAVSVFADFLMPVLFAAAWWFYV